MFPRFSFFLLICCWWQWGSLLVVLGPRVCLAEEHNNNEDYHQDNNEEEEYIPPKTEEHNDPRYQEREQEYESKQEHGEEETSSYEPEQHEHHQHENYESTPGQNDHNGEGSHDYDQEAEIIEQGKTESTRLEEERRLKEEEEQRQEEQEAQRIEQERLETARLEEDRRLKEEETQRLEAARLEEEKRLQEEEEQRLEAARLEKEKRLKEKEQQRQKEVEAQRIEEEQLEAARLAEEKQQEYSDSAQTEEEHDDDDDDYPDDGSQMGVDLSWPMHHMIYQRGSRGRRYLKFMQGCARQYSQEECQRSDRERTMMNLKQPPALMNYTSAGYAKVRAPPGVFSMLKTFHDDNMDQAVRESWPPGNIYTNHWISSVNMLPIAGLPHTEGQAKMQPSLSTQQRQQIISQVQPILEAWCKMPLVSTSLYGIRVYKRGAILAPHVDRLPLVISAIINVDQNLSEDWPLEIIDHSGTAVNVTMKPGEMVLYESATVIHGRPYPLDGQTYSNVFLHFEPVGYSERLDNSADQKRRKDPKALFEEALAEQQSWDTLKEAEFWRKKEQERPYYVPAADEDQWQQKYVYVTKANTKKYQKQMEMKLAAQKNEARMFHNLAAKGMLARMKEMAMEDPTVITKQDTNGWTALHEAARGGKTHVVIYLCGLMTKDQINVRTNKGKGATALWWALHMFHEDHPTVKALLKHGAKSIAPHTA